MTATPRPRFAWRRTLTAAIATRMAAVVLIGLTLVTALLVRALDHQLSNATDTRIRATAAGVSRLAANLGDARVINTGVVSSLVADQALVVLADPADTVVAHLGADAIDPDAVLAATRSLRPGDLVSVDVDGVPLRLTVIEPTRLRVRPDDQSDESQVVARVVIGADTSKDATTVSDLTTTSIGIVAGSAVALLLVAWLATTRATHPLRVMARSASAIAVGGARVRLDESTRYVETDALAAAMNGALDTREKAEDALRAFVADTSHELRAPLTMIQGWTELALQHDDAPAGRATLGRIELEARRMGALLDSLTLLARLDARPDLGSGAVDLADVARQVAREASEASPRGPVEVALDGPARVVGDVDQLRRAVRNLVGNSIQHAGLAATTTVTVDAQGDRVVLRVSDDGTGIDPEALPRVFDRFFTTSPAGSSSSGLGLAIVRGIVSAHHGSITIDSSPLGTTVVIDLPRAD